MVKEDVWLKMMKDKRGINPLLLKLGVALAISFAGFLYSHIRTRRISSTPPPPPSSPHSPSQGHMKINSGSSTSTPTFKDVASILQENIKESPRQRGTMEASPVGFTSSNTDSGDEDEFLLPEFNELVLEEFEAHSNNSSISPRKDVDRSVKLIIALDKETEKEVHNLRKMIHILRERERKLEMQLLEYYGLKEQETAVMELQNRLKISSVESKLFNLKIESLQTDKQRLEAQVADHSNVMAELESARAKIKMLKRKIRLDEEHTRERLSHLQHKVADLQDQEISAGNDLDTQKRLQRLEELEKESTELRITNSRLQYENSELARRLKSTQILATSVSELPEAEALQEANHQLKKENEDLAKEIEQLQANRCADVEELVYLRWVNACLRYELRNYKGPPGKTVARDLSKNLSPKSEEKAKQLIVEYANTEGNGDKGILDFDSEYWSSSQNSSHAESSEPDDSSSVDVSFARTNSSSRSKFFSKLRKLLHGKHSPKHNPSSVDRSPTSYAASGRRESISTLSYEEMRTCFGSTGSSHQDSSLSTMDSTGLESKFEERNINKMVHRSQSMSRASLDTPLRPRRLSLESVKEGEGMRRNSDVGSSFLYKRMILKEESDSGLGNDSQVEKDLASEKHELVKFAEALKGSNISPRTHRSSSYRLF